MEAKKKTLVSPKLNTMEDYVKQREKSRTDFEKFVESRKNSKGESNKKNSKN